MKRKVGSSGSPRLGEPARVVTVIIPAYNEEESSGRRSGTSWPRSTHDSLMDVIVVSDASTDRTDEIARGFAKDGVDLIVQETRRGKTAGLNRALEEPGVRLSCSRTRTPCILRTRS